MIFNTHLLIHRFTIAKKEVEYIRAEGDSRKKLINLKWFLSIQPSPDPAGGPCRHQLTDFSSTIFPAFFFIFFRIFLASVAWRTFQIPAGYWKLIASRIMRAQGDPKINCPKSIISIHVFVLKRVAGYTIRQIWWITFNSSS